MRILLLIENLSLGGRQRTAQNCALAYAGAGHAVAVLCTDGRGPREVHLADAGIPVFGPGGPLRTETPDFLDAAVRWAPDAIHLHSPGPPTPRLAEALRELCMALPERVAVIETSSFGKVAYKDDQGCYHLIDVHLLKSRWMLWKWQQWTQHFRPRPLHAVVPNTVDTQAFYPISEDERAAFRAEQGIPPDAILFGCLARPTGPKWDPLLFRSFADVAAADARAWLFVAEPSAEARRTIAALPAEVRNRIVVHPLLHGDEALRRCYSSLDVFVHACRIGESFGMVFLEALACGTPVISVNKPSKNNSQLEVIGHERGGLLVNDQAGFTIAMQRLLHDETLRTRFADAGGTYVRQHYTMEAVLPLFLDVLHHTLHATDRHDLQHRLEADPHLITHVSDAEVEALMTRTLGRPSSWERLLKFVVHIPAVYRLWTRLRFGR